MSDIPTGLRYRESHEWVRLEADGSVVVGISDHAQAQLGDMVFVELPEPGLSYAQGDACAVVESVKAASDIYAPVSGEVIGHNAALEDNPGLVNSDPYGDGWLFSLSPSDSDPIDGLLTAAEYAEKLHD
ncbi:MAG: glycine cleavage system protein GcvH [Lysobacterales bacterium]